MSPVKIYLDTNEITNCVEPRLAGWSAAGIEALRVALSQRIQRDEVICLGSQFHLEEMSRIPALYRRPILTYFWSIVRWYVLLPTYDLARREVAAGRGLTDNEPFATFDEQQRLKRFSRDDSKLDQLAREIETKAKAGTAEQKQWRADFLGKLQQQFAGVEPEEITRQWWGYPEARFQSWARDYMESSKAHFGLPDDRSKWPAPGDLPTIRAMIISYMARLFLNFAEHRKISDGDRHDSHHYAAASYADVLVTEDKAFRATLEQIPRNAIKVVSFDDFAGIMGLIPH